MTQENPEQISLLDLLPDDVTVKDFKGQIEGCLTNEEKSLLGEEPTERVAGTLFWLASQRPDETFQPSLISNLAGLSDDETGHVLDFASRTGLLAKDADGYLMSPKARSLFRKFW